jgi:2-polyprenyl-6-methoxyphenol hydroxylase-like FAD-dependent oxidoreductase
LTSKYLRREHELRLAVTSGGDARAGPGRENAMTKVLISGAGIAGPTLAYWLLRRGFEPVLVERAPRFRAGGYILDFWGIGFGVAERMDLIPTLRELGYVVDRLRYVRADGSTGAELGADAVRRALGDRYLSVRRGDLAHAIYALVQDDVETIFGDSVVALREDEAGVVVDFERGGTRRFDLVVGCDGLHSTVRAIAFGPQQTFERYLGYFTASFASAGYPLADDHAYLSFTAPGRQISRYSLRDDVTAFFFVWTPSEPPIVAPGDLATQKALIAEAFAQDTWVEAPEIRNRLAASNELYFDSVSQIHMPCWSRGRIALLGDAAFCPSLLAGEGSSFAMAGAYILAGELARANGDYQAAFARYEQTFRPFIERKQKGARRFASTFAPATRFGLLARNQMLRVMNVPILGTWMIRRMAADHLELPAYNA